MKNIFLTKKTWIMACLTFIGILMISSCFCIVESGEVGIRIHLGKVSNHTTSEGINVKMPMIETIEKMNIRVQKIAVTTDSSSKDLQDVNMSLVVNYHIDKEQAVKLYKTVGKGYEQVILTPAIEEGIKAVTSQYTAEDLIIRRSEVSEKCREELEKKVSKYGLVVNDFNITNFAFSEEFSKAIEEKQVAEQKVLTAKQELEKERIEAEKKIVKAEAEKQANELKERSLTDNIIKEKFIEKWNGELPKVTSSSSIMDISNLLT